MITPSNNTNKQLIPLMTVVQLFLSPRPLFVSQQQNHVPLRRQKFFDEGLANVPIILLKKYA